MCGEYGCHSRVASILMIAPRYLWLRELPGGQGEKRDPGIPRERSVDPIPGVLIRPTDNYRSLATRIPRLRLSWSGNRRRQEERSLCFQRGGKGR